MLFSGWFGHRLLQFADHRGHDFKKCMTATLHREVRLRDGKGKATTVIAWQDNPWAWRVVPVGRVGRGAAEAGGGCVVH